MTDAEKLARAIESGLADDLLSAESTSVQTGDIKGQETGPAVRLARVMLEDAIAASPAFMAAVSRPGSVVIIEVPDALWGDEIADAWRLIDPITISLLEQHLASTEAQRSKDVRGSSRSPFPLLIVALEDKRTFVHHEDKLRPAIEAGRGVHAIASDPSLLPVELVASADARLAVPLPNAAQLIRMVRGLFRESDGKLSVPSGIRLASMQPDDLAIAMRPQQSAENYLEKLERVLRARERPEPPGLDALVGLGAAEIWGRQAAADMRAYAAGRLPWSELDRGAVLVGPPGCGKTTFARALAASAGVTFVFASLPVWQADRDGHLGTTLRAMRRSFDEARSLAPSVMLVDEIDSFGSRSSDLGYARTYHTQVVNAFLEHLDGACSREGVLVIGATNDASGIDPAILRSGRLERVISIPLPDRNALAEIIRRQLNGALPEVDLQPLADAAFDRDGTGADIEAWCRGARRTARAAGRPIHLEDLVAEIGEPPPPLSQEARRRIAIHEAGHTIAYLACGAGVFRGASLDACRVGLGTTVSSGMQLTAPFVTRRIMRRHLRALLAGRAAEIELLGDVSSGAGGSASSDLAVATQMALEAVTTSGLDEHEHAVIWRGSEVARGPDLLLARDSEIRERVGAVLAECMADARRLVRRMRRAVEEIADALVERGSLDAPSAAAIVERHFPRQHPE